jgi:hypothetical protein
VRDMKFIIAIILSIFISVFVFGTLIVSGIVSVGKSENNSGLTVTLPIPGKNRNITDENMDVNTIHEADNVVTGTSTINTLALQFFKNFKIKESEDIEELFTQFLVQEQNADEKTVNLMIRKCFWKNFHTLQMPVNNFKSLKSFETEYLMEKKLKTAGFIAMGLTLNENELIKTDKQFKLLQGKMSKIIKERIIL